jgi:CTP synthase
MKYIVVCGGVMSGVGKGVTAASLAVFLKFYGYRVTMIKIDPYLNVDAGTMSPYEHGECFVLDDGTECDLDLGTYERFLDVQLTGDHNLTGGKLLQHILKAERRGDYLGRTVQMVPHMTDAIVDWIQRVARKPIRDWFHEDVAFVEPEICIVELGGTAGDIEGMAYFEAIRQLLYRLPRQDTCVFHVTYVPLLKVNNEPKTKPAQQGVKILRQLGIQPDFVCVRSSLQTLPSSTLEKLANFCQVDRLDIIMNPDVDNIYSIPLQLVELKKFHLRLGQRLAITDRLQELNQDCYRHWVKNIRPPPTTTIHVAIVGKYTATRDTYLSLLYAIKHAAQYLGLRAKIQFVEAQEFSAATIMAADADGGMDAMIIPGGFGRRGIEGMIRAAWFARESKLPLLGICLGLHVMAIELARNLLNIQGANSGEFETDFSDPDAQRVVQEIDPSKTSKGATMKLGLLPTKLQPNTLSHKLYKQYGRYYNDDTNTVQERHRHRFEVSPRFAAHLVDDNHPFCVTGLQDGRVDLIEHQDQFYLGCQYHPELLTRHTKPHPLFIGLLQMAVAQHNTKKKTKNLNS